VFHHVEAGRVLEQPAREHAAPLQRRIGVLALVDDDLHERADLWRVFPRRGAFAGGQADHHVADAARLARLHLDIAGDVVALVQQTQRRDSLIHRRARTGRCLYRSGTGEFGRHLGFFGLGLRRSAGTRRKQRRGRDDRGQPHASGVQAS